MIGATLDTYHYPPRPTNPCAKQQLALFEQEGWSAQVKFDGTCGIFSVLGSEGFRAMTRHGRTKPMVRFTASPDHKAALTSIVPTDKLYVFVAEVMQGRVNAPHLDKQPLVVNDILVADGKSLVGTAYRKRLALLEQLMPGGDEKDTHYEVNDHLWRVRTYEKGLLQFYEHLKRTRVWHPEYEGVVLKRMAAPLSSCDRDNRNSGWQRKSRFADDKDGIVRRAF
jgi:ATP-dependent DNA ligase